MQLLFFDRSNKKVPSLRVYAYVQVVRLWYGIPYCILKFLDVDFNQTYKKLNNFSYSRMLSYLSIHFVFSCKNDVA